MKQTTLILGVLMISAMPARAEFWDSITFTLAAPRLGPITIHAARGEGRLTSLVVTVGTQSASVPQDELKDVLAPDLASVRFRSSWNTDLQRFYVSVETLGSRPAPAPYAAPYATPVTQYSSAPEIIHFHFTNARYSRRERWRKIPPNVNIHFRPEPGIEYLITGPSLFRVRVFCTDDRGPADGATGRAWDTANEFVYRTVLGDEYFLPPSMTGPASDTLGRVRDGVYHVTFRGKRGQGDLLVEVCLRRESNSVKILGPNSPQQLPQTAHPSREESSLRPIPAR